MIYADLHNHSTFSDGSFIPEELLKKAKEKGVKALALTDHDSISGLDDFLSSAKKLEIQAICGVELSLRFLRIDFRGTLHLLLYFKPELLKNKDFKDDINQLFKQGRGPALVRKRVEEINRFFGSDAKEPLLKKDLQSADVLSYAENISRRHFALALKEKYGIADKALISRMIANDSPAYVPSGINMEILSPFLKKYPLLKILAHPAAGSFPGESHYKEVLPAFELVKKMLPIFMDNNICGIDGLEVYYPGHTDAHQSELKEIARKAGLIISGGSDCHDDQQRPPAVKGLSRQEFKVFEEKLDGLSI